MIEKIKKFEINLARKSWYSKRLIVQVSHTLFKFPSRRAYSSNTSCSSGVRVSAGETDVWLVLSAGSEGAGAVDIVLCFYWGAMRLFRKAVRMMREAN
jgi:hypothetical protein